MKRKTNKKTAFTLIELLTVISIIGILSAVGIPAYTGYVDGAEQKRAENFIQTISLLEQDVYADNRTYLAVAAQDNTCNATTGNKLTQLVCENSINDDKYNYKIVVDNTVTPQTYTVTATNISNSGKTITIDQNQLITKNGF